LDFNIDFNLVRSQKLLLIPQLKLALEILEMNSQELMNYVDSQLESNPALELPPEELPEEDCEEKNSPENTDDDTDAPAETTGSALSLKEHLLIQLHALHMDKNGLEIGEYLIDNTDENGYLAVEIREVADFFKIPQEKVLKVLELLHSFDPPGICARNLTECLLLQLAQMDDADPAAIQVVQDHLEKLAAGDDKGVAKATGLSPERVRNIFLQVRSLEPKPGREYYVSEAGRVLQPDFIVRENGSGLQALENMEAFPDVCISESFKADAETLAAAEGGRFVHESVQSAVWLMKCLEQRKRIIYEIAEKFLEYENEFFKDGPNHRKLLDKPTFAASLDIHETILDKAIKGKYLQCKWGIFGYGSFFS
jgi:RNA polymerase sigma-54 factor